MTAPYNPPLKGDDFKIRIALEDLNSPGSFRSNPTITASDFKVDIDGAGYNNLATLPSVSPANSATVLLTLSTAEMNGDVVTVLGICTLNPKQWADFVLSIPTTSS